MNSQLGRAVRSFYEESKAGVRVCREEGRRFNVTVGLRQGCVMSPWLFNLYMDGVVRVESKDHECRCLLE